MKPPKIAAKRMADAPRWTTAQKIAGGFWDRHLERVRTGIQIKYDLEALDSRVARAALSCFRDTTVAAEWLTRVNDNLATIPLYASKTARGRAKVIQALAQIKKFG
jgi:hypothetical protein